MSEELRSYLPHASEELLTELAGKWIHSFGRDSSPDDVNPGLRTDFLRRHGGSAYGSPVL